MGFPATTGANFLPYLITDKVVAPESCKHCYSEQLAYMPNCYFVNDYKAAHMDVLDEANLPPRYHLTLSNARSTVQGLQDSFLVCIVPCRSLLVTQMAYYRCAGGECAARRDPAHIMMSL